MPIGLCYGGKLEEDGTIQKQVEGRCAKTAQLFHSGEISAIAMIGGDGKGIKKYFLRLGVPEKNIIQKFFPEVVDTKTETDCFARLVKKIGEEKFIAVSSWFHIPRVWISWLANGRLVRVASSFKGVEAKDLFREAPRLFASLFVYFLKLKLWGRKD